MLIGQYGCGWQHGGGDDPAALRLGGSLRHVELGEVRLVQRIQHRVGNLVATDEGVVRRVLQVLRLAHPGAHRVPLTGTQNDQAQEAVAAREDRIDRARAHPNLTAWEAGPYSGQRIGHRPVRHLRRTLVQGDVQDVAPSGLQPLP